MHAESSPTHHLSLTPVHLKRANRKDHQTKPTVVECGQIALEQRRTTRLVLHDKVLREEEVPHRREHVHHLKHQQALLRS